MTLEIGGDEYAFEEHEVPFDVFPTPNENEVRHEEVPNMHDGENVEDDDEITDSKFEKSDKDEVSVPRADNDPTKNWGW